VVRLTGTTPTTPQPYVISPDASTFTIETGTSTVPFAQTFAWWAKLPMTP
jgi:hypothetical protein